MKDFARVARIFLIVASCWIGAFFLYIIFSIAIEQDKNARSGVVPTPRPTPKGCGTAETVLRSVGASPRKGWREVQFLSRDWNSIPFDTKKYLVTQIAECLAPSPSTTILDAMTGKELASYSPLWGVKINN
jgi:hypothetical protein